MMRLATNKKRGHTNTRIRIRIHFVDRQDFALPDLLEKLLTA